MVAQQSSGSPSLETAVQELPQQKVTPQELEKGALAPGAKWNRDEVHEIPYKYVLPGSSTISLANLISSNFKIVLPGYAMLKTS